MIPLEKLESFMRLLHAVQNVERVARIPDETKRRNTAEHTFELALLSWYIASVDNLDLDNELILKYALAHDLIEGYAGDTYIYDEESQRTKKERERQAIERIEKEFLEFPELIKFLHAYERREDDESKFVYAADKLIDPVNISMETKTPLWREFGITYDAIRSYKDAKIAHSAHIVPYWEALMKKVQEKKDFFFKN